MIAYFEDILSTINASVKSLDTKEFEALVVQCVECIKRNDKIIASGLGKNVPICEKFVGTLNSLGINASFLHTNTAMHGDLGLVKPTDLVILLSKSGNTGETVLLAEKLIKRKTKTWLFSFNENNVLNSTIKNKIILDLKNEGDPWNIVPNNSTSVYLIVMQGLAMTIADSLGITLLDFKENHPGGAIGDALQTLC